MSLLFESQGLSRWYGEVVGLNDVTLTLEQGVIGLLGPNGAGKSTFLKLVAGEILPSRGSLRVLGHVPFANPDYFRELGFCPQQDALYEDLSGFEFVRTLLLLSGFSAPDAHGRAEIAIERVKLTDAMHRRTREYSKGMRQRIKLAQAIAHGPRLLLLDEPLAGLDPLARRDMLELFGALAAEGLCLLLSSHVLHEIESLTQNIVLLHRGRLLAQGPVSEIRGLLARHPHKVAVRARDPRALGRALLALEGVREVRLGPEPTRLEVSTFDVEALYRAIPALAAAERAGIHSFEATDAGMDAVFDYLIG